ncbi:MAG: NAD(P)-dependent oxidoreductase [Waddliaceae bacterium]
MKILVAGATGAIGQPLVDILIKFGFDVYGLTHSKSHAQLIAGKGAKPLVLDILDQKAVFTAFENVRPEVVIDMLTSLPKEYTPEMMARASENNRKVRIEGGGNLYNAASNFDTKRYIVQSCGFLYAPGKGLADENVPFALDAAPNISAAAHLYEDIERRVLLSDKMEGVALRFGFFYGPGTWYHPLGSVAEQIRNRAFPLIGKGEGVWNFIHVEDGAKAAAEAIYSSPGTYNVVNSHPAKMSEWLPAFARYLNAPPPYSISEEEGLKVKGEDFIYYCTKLRGASNAKAIQEFNFIPRSLEWLR